MSRTRYNADIQVLIEPSESLPLERLERAAEWVLARHDQPDGTEMSIVIMDDVAVQRLNRQFRQVDKPTDVLSFPAEPVPGDDDSERYLGDLILALPYIQRQALVEHHAWQDEIVLAVIHGTLHLLGYDHDSAEKQGVMWRIQAEALRALDVPITVPLFEFEEDEGHDSASQQDVPGDQL